MCFELFDIGDSSTVLELTGGHVLVADAERLEDGELPEAARDVDGALAGQTEDVGPGAHLEQPLHHVEAALTRRLVQWCAACARRSCASHLMSSTK